MSTDMNEGVSEWVCRHPPISNEYYDQGDQIGRIFAHYMTILGAFFNQKSRPYFGGAFSKVKVMHYFLQNNGLGYIYVCIYVHIFVHTFWAIFFRNSSGHPDYDQKDGFHVQQKKKQDQKR
jgi:hypothetical protein